MLEYIILPRDNIEQWWEVITRFLRPVIEMSYGEVTLIGIKDRLLSGNELALCVFDDSSLICVCILGLTEFETGKRVLQMPYVGGMGIDTWLEDGFTVINEIARKYNCTHIRGCGREGWGRVLPRLKRIRTVYECEVSE